VATASSKERVSFAHAFQVLNADVAACAASLHRGSHMQVFTALTYSRVLRAGVIEFVVRNSHI